MQINEAELIVILKEASHFLCLDVIQCIKMSVQSYYSSVTVFQQQNMGLQCSMSGQQFK